MPSKSSHQVGAGQVLQLMFAHCRDLVSAANSNLPAVENWSEGSAVATAAKQQLLRTSRTVHTTAASPAAGGSTRRSREAASTATVGPEYVDLVIEWNAADRAGEVYALQVPCERPGAPPCPLDMHLLAPETAVLTPGLTVSVTLRVRNASAAGDVSFYFVADAVQEFVWLGCERSEVIRLSPQASHSATLQAYFGTPGVFNLNRFRIFVVGMPLGAGPVPASEQAPLAFAFPFERLIHIRVED